MAEYEVVYTATISKVFHVEAETSEEAEDKAQALFEDSPTHLCHQCDHVGDISDWDIDSIREMG